MAVKRKRRLVWNVLTESGNDQERRRGKRDAAKEKKRKKDLYMLIAFVIRF